MKNYLLFFVSLLAFGGFSCTSNIDGNEGLEGKSKLVLNLSVAGLETNVSTRATEEGNKYGDFNENKINKIDVFFYRGENLAWYPGNISIEPTPEADAKQITIPVPIMLEKMFDGTQAYDIYVVVNGPASYLMRDLSLSGLKNLITTTNFSATNRVSSQPGLLMDGRLLNAAPVLNGLIGSVELQRAAAKIRVRMVKGGTFINEYVDGSSGATPLVKVVNYNEKTTLFRESVSFANGLVTDQEYRPATLKVNDGVDGVTTPFPIYSYSNDWSEQSENETYLMARIPLRYPNPDVDTYYYYKIFIDHLGKKMERNYVYDIEVLFNQLGGTEESPVLVNGKLTVLPWTEKEYSYSIDSTRYLYFYPRQAILYGVNRQQFTMSSAVYPISFNTVSSTYSYANSNGTVVTGSDNVSNLSFKVNEPSAGYVTMNATAINDYLARNISFRVTNGFITKQVIATQYPPVYITNEMAAGSKPLYIIHTIQQTGSTVLAFPLLDNDGNTLNRADVANMVSPSFMVATTDNSVTTYAAAQTYCADLTEGTYTDWRMPTTAEIAYAKGIQNNANSKVKSIFPSAGTYWSASAATGTVVRCVRDVKK